MSEVKKEVLLEKIKELVVKANTTLRPDVLDALKEARAKEENPNGKKALTMLIENAGIAKKEGIPICQDTGYVDIYFIWPVSIALRNDLQDIADEAVKQAYSEKPFRKSIVAEPLFERKNTNSNTPANINIFTTVEEKLQIRVVIKGAGSDNS
ncbi:MAG: fumarate hydratase, partial [Actinobacteria bacterium]